MTAFRILLVLMFIILIGYTVAVGIEHGWGLFPVFFGDIAAMTWPGQFNLDFSGYLLLSALWYAWRDHFSPAGLVMGAIGFVGGMSVLLPYLLLVSIRNQGNMAAILMGRRRAGTA